MSAHYDRPFRDLAGDWHGGQGSPMYAYSSTGTIVDGLVAEIDEATRDRERTAHDTYPLDAERDLAELAAFRAYVLDTLCATLAPDTIPTGYYSIEVRTERTDADGWHSVKHSPTFYLHSNVQGIVSEAHAERIAVDMFRDMLPAGDTGTVHARATFVGTP